MEGEDAMGSLGVLQPALYIYLRFTIGIIRFLKRRITIRNDLMISLTYVYGYGDEEGRDKAHDPFL